MMRDLANHLEDHPGALAEMGEALGSAGVSVFNDSIRINPVN